MKATGRVTLGYVARATVSLALLAIVVLRVDWGAFIAALRDARPEMLSLALATVWLAVAARAYSFALVVNRPRRLVTLAQSAALTLAGNGAALVLPGLAGDLLKAHVAWRAHGEPERIASGTVIDKLTSLAAIGILAAIAAGAAGRPGFAVLGAGVGLTALVALVAPRIVPWRLLARIVAPRAVLDAERMASATALDTARYAYVIAVSLVGWLLSFGAIALVCEALGVSISYAEVVVAGCAMTIASLIPLSIAGLGISQVTLVGALAWFGVGAQIAASVALTHLALVLTPAAAGAIMLAFGYARPREIGRPALSVGMVTTVYPRGDGDATGSFIASLAEALSASGMTVSIYAPHAPGLTRVEVRHGVRVTRFVYLPERLEALAYAPEGIPAELRRRPLGALALPFLVLAIGRAARQASKHVDVLHAHWAPVALIAALAQSRAPIVVTLHGTDVELAERSAFWRAVTLAALWRANAVICVSGSLAARVATLPGFPGTPITVIGNGVDDALFTRRRDRSDSAARRIVFVGRLSEGKGAPCLLEAFAGALPETRLEFIGGGPLAASLAARAKELGVAARVVFVGATDHPQALERLASADLVVVPSRQEGFSLVALEAAALGVPCVGSRVGVLPDLLAEDALTVPGDVSELTALIRRVLASPALADAMAAHARERARAFTWIRIAASTRDSYDRVTEGGE